MNTLIRNGRIIDPANKRDEVGDLAIVDGRIADLSAIRDTRSAIDLALAQLRGALDGNADYWETR